MRNELTTMPKRTESLVIKVIRDSSHHPWQQPLHASYIGLMQIAQGDLKLVADDVLGMELSIRLAKILEREASLLEIPSRAFEQRDPLEVVACRSFSPP